MTEKKGVERNPAHYCMGDCGKYLGFRGFCSQKCHDRHYDALCNFVGIEGVETASDQPRTAHRTVPTGCNADHKSLETVLEEKIMCVGDRERALTELRKVIAKGEKLREFAKQAQYKTKGIADVDGWKAFHEGVENCADNFLAILKKEKGL